jgi:hypothetical protein
LHEKFAVIKNAHGLFWVLQIVFGDLGKSLCEVLAVIAPAETVNFMGLFW